MYFPYAWLRALRFGALWGYPPGGDRAEQRRFSRLVLSSGWVSFFWLAAVPLRIGELSRPWLWVTRLPRRGVQKPLERGMSRALGVTAAERVSDLGCVLLLLLAGGRWSVVAAFLADELSLWLPGGWPQWGGILGAGLFVFGLLLWRRRGMGPESEKIDKTSSRRRLYAWIAALRAGLATLWASPQRGVFWIQTMLYWGITTLQLWVMAQAFALSLSIWDAAAVVAFVALSIQLPAGPGQVGSYQLGAWAALEHVGAVGSAPSLSAEALVSFVTAMWLMQLLGAAAMALVGWYFLPARDDRSEVGKKASA